MHITTKILNFILSSYDAYFKNPVFVYVYNHDNGKFDFRFAYYECNFTESCCIYCSF